MEPRRPLVLVGLVLLVCGCSETRQDPLPRMNIPVTAGAAAGYVPDETCARCHADLYRSYQKVGMARSFYRPATERLIEDFEAEPYVHPSSERTYRMRRNGEKVLFERWVDDAEGNPAHRIEIEVDWILGSGHTSRTYLFQTPAGELYQLPVAWYSQTGSWGMAPGFDHADPYGVERQVHRECMFCHNAYPEVPAESDAYGEPHIFPAELPEGIGCQRCHGPGAEHVRAAVLRDREATLATVVNPARLPPERRMDVCYGCHFQPSVVLFGVRRFGRDTYSFRPGEPLTDYLVPIDVEEAHQSREERFEINHHPYRLEQSACFRESEPGALTCMTCHDPHRKVTEERRLRHFRDACLSCHQVDACSLDAMRDAAGLAAAGLGSVADDDCAACHMPRRRTQDVVHVVMTDHLIQRRPGGPELTAPLEETVPVLTDAELLRPVPGISPALAEIYKASAVARAGGSAEATRFLAHALPRQPLTTPEPLLDLIRGLLGQRQFAEVELVAGRALESWPDLVRAREWRAIARVQLGDHQGALADLAAVLAADGERPEALFNQGLVLFILERHEEAAASLRRAVALRPTLPRAWAYLGRALAALGRPGEAEQALRRALAVDPGDPQTTIDLARLLADQGERAKAVRILEIGTRQARFPEPVEQALAEIDGGRSAP